MNITMPYEVAKTVVVDGQVYYRADLICPQSEEVVTTQPIVDIVEVLDSLVGVLLMRHNFSVPNPPSFSGRLETFQDLVDTYENRYQLGTKNGDQEKLEAVISDFNQEIGHVLSPYARGMNVNGDFIGWVKL